MNAVLAYGRLVARPRTGFQLYLVVCVGLAVCVVGAGIGAFARGEGGGTNLDRVRLTLIAVPFLLGLAAVAPVCELAHAQFARHLPGLRRALGLALATIGLIASALTVGTLTLVERLAAPPAPALGLAVLAFVLGLFAFDWLHPRAALVRGSLAGMALLVVAFEPLTRFAAAWPRVSALAALGAAAVLFPYVLARETLRHKALLRVQLARGFALLPSRRLDDIAVERASHPVPPPIPRGDRPWAWARLAAFETLGTSPRGWMARAAVIVLALPVVLCLYEIGLGLAGGASAREALVQLRSVLVDSGPGVAPGTTPDFLLIFGSGLLLLLLGTGAAGALPAQRLLPLSRRERAAVVWRLHLVSDAAVPLVIGLCLLLVSEALSLALGIEGRGGPWPNWLRPMLVVLALAPFARCLQFGRSGRGPKRTFPALEIRNVVGMTVAAMGATGLSRLWATYAAAWPPPGWFLVVASIAIAGQLALRARIRSWYARVDLVP